MTVVSESYLSNNTILIFETCLFNQLSGCPIAGRNGGIDEPDISD